MSAVQGFGLESCSCRYHTGTQPCLRLMSSAVLVLGVRYVQNHMEFCLCLLSLQRIQCAAGQSGTAIQRDTARDQSEAHHCCQMEENGTLHIAL